MQHETISGETMEDANLQTTEVTNEEVKEINSCGEVSRVNLNETLKELFVGSQTNGRTNFISTGESLKSKLNIPREFMNQTGS